MSRLSLPLQLALVEAAERVLSPALSEAPLGSHMGWDARRSGGGYSSTAGRTRHRCLVGEGLHDLDGADEEEEVAGEGRDAEGAERVLLRQGVVLERRWHGHRVEEVRSQRHRSGHANRLLGLPRRQSRRIRTSSNF